MPIIRGPVRARDLRANVKEFGAQEGVIFTLEQLLDEHVQDRQNLREMSNMLDKVVDQLSNFIRIGGELQKELTELKRVNKQGDAIEHGNP